MNNLPSVRAIIHGRVQGVFFRAFVSKQAKELGLTGFVCNLPDGRTLEVQAEGERKNLEKLLKRLKVGPPGAGVEKVETIWSEHGGSFSDFSIRY
jgi:acylphosphatase